MKEAKSTILDDLDRKILNCVQKSVPLAERPFQVLAEELGTTEKEVINRMRRMWDPWDWEGIPQRLVLSFI